MNNEIQELIPFNNACNELSTGKYILIDLKLNSLLKIVDSDQKLSSIVNDCVANFDFTSKYKQMLAESLTGTFLMPTNDNDIVAFVYNILYRVANKEIDLYEFLSRFFMSDDKIGSTEFSNFGSVVIIPFKNAMNNLYSKRFALADTTISQTEIYNKIKTNIKFILTQLDTYKLSLNEKEEFSMLLNSLFLACEKFDKKLIFTLMIGIDYFTKCHKKSRVAYQILEECFEKQN